MLRIGKMRKITKGMQKYKLDLLALQEVDVKKEKVKNKNSILYYFEKQKQEETVQLT